MQSPQLRAMFPQEITFGRAAGYAFLPGIIPRLRSLSWVISRFLFTLSQSFGTVGLIDRNHPCLQPQNIGLYRFRDVVGLAFYGLLQDRKNLNKIVMFSAVVGTFLLTVGLAVVSLAMAASYIPQAHAQYFSDNGTAPYNPGNDWAYQFLGEVFGDIGVNFWGGAGSSSMVPKHLIFTPMLQSMFSTYSQALLVIAVFMIIYHIVVMVAESARTGQPFGQNFNSVWAPVRLALAIGMLVPVANGYNTAQLIAFQVSNWGSALATNVWTNALAMDNTKLIGAYQPPEIYDVMRAAFLGKFCVAALQNVGNKGDVDAGGAMTIEDDKDAGYRYYYFSSIDNGDPDDIYVKDYCGAIKVPLPTGLVDYQIKSADANGNEIGFSNAITYGYLAQEVSTGYNSAVNQILLDANNGPTGVANTTAAVLLQQQTTKIKDIAKANQGAGGLGDMHRAMLQHYRTAMGMTATTGKGDYLAAFAPDALLDTAAVNAILTDGKRYGWAGAGSFMLTIAAVNSTISDAISRPPQVVALPRILTNAMASPYEPNATIEDDGFWDWLWGSNPGEAIKEINRVVNSAASWFKDWGTSNNFSNHTNPQVRIRLSEWNQQLTDNSSREQGRVDTDITASAQSMLIRTFMPGSNSSVNPLGRIVSLGNGLIIFAGILGAAAIIATFIPFVSGAGLSTILVSIATVAIGAGYTLAVVLPLSLFTNFMFAVIEWVISVFEAVVGMPLWCLSFITVDGEGIGGKAMSGVMMLFELMLRPTIIIIATVGSFLIFSASVHFMDKAFGSFLQSYYASPAGSSGSGTVMALGSIFIYAMTIYSIGNSAFKMIPAIANNFMRWIGGPNGFSGTMNADMQQISGAAAMAGLYTMGSQAVGGLEKGVERYRQKKAGKKQAAEAAQEKDHAFRERQFDRTAAESRHQEMMGALNPRGGGQTPAGQNPNPYGGGNIGFNRGGNNQGGGGTGGTGGGPGGSAPPGSTP